MNIVINGRFVAQRTTGVQRFARELVVALDRLLGSPEYAHMTGRVRLAVPGASVADAPRLDHIGVLPVAGKAGHPWEQFALPLATRGSVLLNLAGGAPACKSGQVCTLHDAAVFDHPEAYRPSFVAWYRSLFRLQARTSRLLLTVSEFSRRRLATTLGIAPARLQVVPNGADHILRPADDADALRRLGLVPQTYLMAVGSANPTKNFPALVEAFRSMSVPSGIRLVIVGGTNSAVFTGAALAAGDERLVLAGSVDDAGLKTLYSQALAFVFPSTYEGFGIPPLEAMACACPVVASTAEAVVETCGDAALYFDPHDMRSMTTALDAVMRDADLRMALQRKGRDRAAGFTWQAAAQQLLAHLGAAGMVERRSA